MDIDEPIEPRINRVDDGYLILFPYFYLFCHVYILDVQSYPRGYHVMIEIPNNRIEYNTINPYLSGVSIVMPRITKSGFGPNR